LASSSETLVVDLDGTLLRSDTLFESFWSALRCKWSTPFLSVVALTRGRVSLKRYLAKTANIVIETLPYDTKVLTFIKEWRSSGGRTALVTASDEVLAKAIADHLGIFDEVCGSKDNLNLKGENKGAYLEETFGLKGFAYMGDAPSDLAVWKRADTAITVNATGSLRKKVEKTCDKVEHLETGQASLWSYAKAVRPHQWLKNLLVFLPLLAAHQFDGPTFLKSLVAFISFSLVASNVYVLNDLLDLASDREHPRKRRRPFASGAIPIAHGTWLAMGLILIGGTLALVVGWNFVFTLAAYYFLTTAYSLHLKRRMVVDIFVLAGLYTMRIVAGSAATAIPISVWLLAFSIFFFLALAAVKRQAELIDNANRGILKATGRGYHVDDLPIISQIAIGAGFVSVLVLALYVNSPEVRQLYPSPEALWGVCVVLLYWITRAVMVAHRGNMHDDPVVYAVKDRISQICLIAATTFVLGGTLL
jgi:4-hydroxybenzoate polyprenyltransferase/phosphoserine phosphatase